MANLISRTYFITEADGESTAAMIDSYTVTGTRKCDIMRKNPREGAIDAGEGKRGQVPGLQVLSSRMSGKGDFHGAVGQSADRAAMHGMRAVCGFVHGRGYRPGVAAPVK